MANINVTLDKKAKEVVAKTANIGGDTPTPTPTKKLYQYVILFKDGYFSEMCNSINFYVDLISDYNCEVNSRESFKELLENTSSDLMNTVNIFGDNNYYWHYVSIYFNNEDRIILVDDTEYASEYTEGSTSYQIYSCEKTEI